MDKTWTKPRRNLDIDIDIDNDIDINIMSKDIIFSELCPTEHNLPRNVELGVGDKKNGWWNRKSNLTTMRLAKAMLGRCVSGEG